MARREKARLPEGDDGKTIVNMDVEGMPWYLRRRNPSADVEGRDKLSPQELRAYKWAAVKAGLAVALIFAAVFGLFIAFCDFVWFK